jgi:hypothetical protein
MNRMQTNRSGRMPHPVNPVHPVRNEGVNEIIGIFGGADQSPGDVESNGILHESI